MVTCPLNNLSPYEGQHNLEPDRKRARIDHIVIDDYATKTADGEHSSSSSKDVSATSSNSVVISNIPPTVTSNTLRDFVERSLCKYRVRVVGCYFLEQHRAGSNMNFQQQVVIKMDLETKYQARMALNLNFVIWKDHTLYVRPWYHNNCLFDPHRLPSKNIEQCGSSWPTM